MDIYIFYEAWNLSAFNVNISVYHDDGDHNDDDDDDTEDDDNVKIKQNCPVSWLQLLIFLQTSKIINQMMIIHRHENFLSAWTGHHKPANLPPKVWHRKI